MSQLLRPPLRGLRSVVDPISEYRYNDDNNDNDKAFAAKKNVVDSHLRANESIYHDDDYDVYIEHFFLFRRLQQYWLSFDAYSRVAMILGTNQFLYALLYLGMAYFVVRQGQLGMWSFIILMVTFDLAHLNMNLLLTNKEFWPGENDRGKR
jgi:hypothetical protein